MFTTEIRNLSHNVVWDKKLSGIFKLLFSYQNSWELTYGDENNATSVKTEITFYI